MTNELDLKIKQSINLLQVATKNIDVVELAYSGGKDSDVILQLAKEAGINYKAIYKCTTIDPKGTIKHCLDNGVEIVRPKYTFFELIRKMGFPSRFRRFCCSYLKEYKIMDNVIIGIRKEESVKRAKRYKEPIVCRVYNKKERVNQIMPILDWTKEDIKAFVLDRGIKLHPLYYDAKGNIDCTRRLGCIGCPLQSDNGLADFKQNPKMLLLWLKNGKKWWDNKTASGWQSYYFDDFYEYACSNIFNKSVGRTVLNKEAFFKTDYKKQLEIYFDITL